MNFYFLQYISILIGSNDICSEICQVPSLSTFLEDYKMTLIKTLRIFRDNLPRTLVSVNTTPNLESLVDSIKGKPSLTCYVMTQLECPCLFGLQYEDKLSEYYDTMHKYVWFKRLHWFKPEQFFKLSLLIFFVKTIKRTENLFGVFCCIHFKVYENIFFIFFLMENGSATAASRLKRPLGNSYREAAAAPPFYWENKIKKYFRIP